MDTEWQSIHRIGEALLASNGRSVSGKEVAALIPSGGRTNWQVVAQANCCEAPKSPPHVKRICGMDEKAEFLRIGRRPRGWRRNWMSAGTDFSGVKEGDMSIRICSESTDPLAGGLGAAAQLRCFV